MLITFLYLRLVIIDWGLQANTYYGRKNIVFDVLLCNLLSLLSIRSGFFFTKHPKCGHELFTVEGVLAIEAFLLSHRSQEEEVDGPVLMKTMGTVFGNNK